MPSASGPGKGETTCRWKRKAISPIVETAPLIEVSQQSYEQQSLVDRTLVGGEQGLRGLVIGGQRLREPVADAEPMEGFAQFRAQGNRSALTLNQKANQVNGAKYSVAVVSRKEAAPLTA